MTTKNKNLQTINEKGEVSMKKEPLTSDSVYFEYCGKCPNAFICHEREMQFCEDEDSLKSNLISLIVEGSMSIEDFNKWAIANNEEELVELPEGFYYAKDLK